MGFDKFKQKAKKIIKFIIKNPRRFLIILTLGIGILLLLVIASKITFHIDTAGSDGSPSVMSMTVYDTLGDVGISRPSFAGINGSTNGNKSSKKIAEEKIYYIGDSDMVGLENSGKAKSPSSYFYAKGSMNADWVNTNYNIATETAINGKSLKDSIPNDASCIVVGFGSNGTTAWADTKTLIKNLKQDYPNKSIFVVQTFHVGESYRSGGSLTAERMNSEIDTYNQNMQKICNENGIKFINPNINIVEDYGTGYLKSDYCYDDGMHLNNSGNEVWYSDIIKCINASNASNSSGGKTTGTGSGQVISESDYYTTGYSGIYESRTTGRKFTEYKQNADQYLSNYPLAVGTWHKECGTVTTIIVGSGYSENATFADAYNNLKNNGYRNRCNRMDTKLCT